MRTLQDALQTASAIRALRTLKLDASQQDQISLVDEIDRLRASNAELLAVLKLGAAALRYSMAVSPLNDKVYLQTEATEKSMRDAIAKAKS